MKHIHLFFAFFLVLFSGGAFAKGAGGAHCAAHAHACIPVYNAYSYTSHDDDVFKELRKNICTGYVVYKSDTMDGVIVCTDNTICLKMSDTQDSTYTYSITDTNLRYAILRDNGLELCLERLENKKLYRQFHVGKLSIYDTYFSFDRSSKKFFDEQSWVKYEGHSLELNSFWTTSVKRKLVVNINKAYGLALNPRQYKKTELLAYLNTLH